MKDKKVINKNQKGLCLQGLMIREIKINKSLQAVCHIIIEKVQSLSGGLEERMPFLGVGSRMQPLRHLDSCDGRTLF